MEINLAGNFHHNCLILDPEQYLSHYNVSYKVSYVNRSICFVSKINLFDGATNNQTANSFQKNYLPFHQL